MRAGILLVLSVALGGTLLVGGAPNVPLDTDGDGDADQVLVTDWDGDGTLEMEDVQAAVDALTDPGDKWVTIGPGRFEGPTSVTRAGILVLPSNIVIEGNGPTSTTLSGFAPDNVTSVQPVVTNVPGASNVTVRELEIDGAWDGGDATGFQHARMGMFFDDCTNCRVEFAAVRDTLHTCLYARNSDGIYFEHNDLTDCGNYAGTGSTYPCIYLFAKDGETLRNAWVTDNTCTRSGSNALNLRAADPTSGFEELHFSGNVVTDTRVVDGRAQYCLIISQTKSSTFLGTTCTNTGSLFMLADAFGAISDILIDGLTLQNLGPKGHGLQLLGHLENVTFRNITVDGTPSDRECILYDNPLRNVVFENLDLSNCGRRGIAELQEFGTGPGENDGMTLRHVTIRHVDSDRQDGFDWSGIDFLGPVRGLFMEDVTIEDASLDGVLLSDGLSLSTVRNVVVRDVGRHGVLFEDLAEYVTFEGLDIDGAGSHGIFVGSGDFRHVVIRDSTVRNVAGHGLTASGSGVVLEDFVLQRTTIEATGLKAIDLRLSASIPSSGLTLADNLLQDFGLAAPGTGNAVGIDITGSISGLQVGMNALIDSGGQALLGIRHQPSPAPADPSYVCTNVCGGALTTSTCHEVGGNPGYQLDGDLDGRVDRCDNCPAVANPAGGDADGDGLGDACDDDDDGDGELDAADSCPLDALDDQDGDALCADEDNCPDRSNPGQDDADADGSGDECDNCIVLANADQADGDDDGQGDVCDDDDDDDGLPDAADPCPLDPQNDTDADGVCAGLDNCPGTANDLHLDNDLDGVGDACDDCPSWPNASQADSDVDGIGDACDACPADAVNDPDGDALCASTDNCPFVANPGQQDADSDAAGNACDACPIDPYDDQDQDGLCADVDNCPATSNPSQADSDHDGVGNFCDNCLSASNADQADDDVDAVGDACDNCPLDNNAAQSDGDGDRLGDVCDNCPLDNNAAQSDLDADLEGDVCDVDDGTIHLFHPAVGLVDWQDEVGYDTWNLYLGSLSLLKTTGIYTQVTAPRYCALTQSETTDLSAVPPGDGLFSLVTGVTLGVEGDLGSDSAGVPRQNTAPCP